MAHYHLDDDYIGNLSETSKFCVIHTVVLPGCILNILLRWWMCGFADRRCFSHAWGNVGEKKMYARCQSWKNWKSFGFFFFGFFFSVWLSVPPEEEEFSPATHASVENQDSA